MKSGNRNKLVALIIIIFSLSIFYLNHNDDKEYNKIRCRTIPLAIIGKIKKIDGRQKYACIFLDSSTVGISFDVAKVKYKKGFNKYHIYAAGDSVLKKAYSKEVVIKNGDSICIFELECND